MRCMLTVLKSTYPWWWWWENAHFTMLYRGAHSTSSEQWTEVHCTAIHSYVRGSVWDTRGVGFTIDWNKTQWLWWESGRSWVIMRTKIMMIVSINKQKKLWWTSSEKNVIFYVSGSALSPGQKFKAHQTVVVSLPIMYLLVCFQTWNKV